MIFTCVSSLCFLNFFCSDCLEGHALGDFISVADRRGVVKVDLVNENCTNVCCPGLLSSNHNLIAANTWALIKLNVLALHRWE